MLAALSQEIHFLAHQDPFPVVIGVENITSRLARLAMSLFQILRMAWRVGRRSTSYESGLCWKETPISVTGGTEKTLMMAMGGSARRYGRHTEIVVQGEDQ